ncbi:hypothetical protein Pelo_13479 [Pelomyxa schiedti]|nr:hypothetical protein Pelo_13479 [Pelomyxa schiedti]
MASSNGGDTTSLPSDQQPPQSAVAHDVATSTTAAQPPLPPRSQFGALDSATAANDSSSSSASTPYTVGAAATSAHNDGGAAADSSSTSSGGGGGEASALYTPAFVVSSGCMGMGSMLAGLCDLAGGGGGTLGSGAGANGNPAQGPPSGPIDATAAATATATAATPLPTNVATAATATTPATMSGNTAQLPLCDFAAASSSSAVSSGADSGSGGSSPRSPTLARSPTLPSTLAPRPPLPLPLSVPGTGSPVLLQQPPPQQQQQQHSSPSPLLSSPPPRSPACSPSPSPSPSPPLPPPPMSPANSPPQSPRHGPTTYFSGAGFGCSNQVCDGGAVASPTFMETATQPSTICSLGNSSQGSSDTNPTSGNTGKPFSFFDIFPTPQSVHVNTPPVEHTDSLPTFNVPKRTNSSQDSTDKPLETLSTPPLKPPQRMPVPPQLTPTNLVNITQPSGYQLPQPGPLYPPLPSPSFVPPMGLPNALPTPIQIPFPGLAPITLGNPNPPSQSTPQVLLPLLIKNPLQQDTSILSSPQSIPASLAAQPVSLYMQPTLAGPQPSAPPQSQMTSLPSIPIDRQPLSHMPQGSQAHLTHTIPISYSMPMQQMPMYNQIQQPMPMQVPSIPMASMSMPPPIGMQQPAFPIPQPNFMDNNSLVQQSQMALMFHEQQQQQLLYQQQLMFEQQQQQQMMYQMGFSGVCPMPTIDYYTKQFKKRQKKGGMYGIQY